MRVLLCVWAVAVLQSVPQMYAARIFSLNSDALCGISWEQLDQLSSLPPNSGQCVTNNLCLQILSFLVRHEKFWKKIIPLI